MFKKFIFFYLFSIISIPARYVSLEAAKEIVSVFLNTELKGGRHQKRVLQIPCTP
ncbi:RpiB/LacA/LacB family sugar-phosphate isomerase [Reinekea sp.]|uniref:RpiB/LacA/LacB family sugar-phosphate isomerase n=1 Tax=Reinekea sp. TaxID=1970455 RepID=UPI0039C11A99